MNWSGYGWRIVAVVIIVAGWWFFRQRSPEPSVEEATPLVTQEDNLSEQFLEERGIEIPEDSQRVALKDINKGDLTGVTAWSAAGEDMSVTIIVSAPDLQTGSYTAWLRQNGTYTRLGTLGISKTGHLLDTRVQGNVFTEAQAVVVSRESTLGSQPTVILLEGELGD